jgi:hypothetical protein
MRHRGLQRAVSMLGPGGGVSESPLGSLAVGGAAHTAAGDRAPPVCAHPMVLRAMMSVSARSPALVQARSQRDDPQARMLRHERAALRVASINGYLATEL